MIYLDIAIVSLLECISSGKGCTKKQERTKNVQVIHIHVRDGSAARMYQTVCNRIGGTVALEVHPELVYISRAYTGYVAPFLATV